MMSTLALLLGQLFMFKKFKKPVVNFIFNGPILWSETDKRFEILTPNLFKRELPMHFIKFY